MTLVLDGITRVFGPVRALDDVSLTVGPGECRALYGGNGSGKSTLAKIASGTLASDTGRVLVDDRPLGRADPARARSLGVGMTFQELSLIPLLTAGENVVLTDMPGRAGLLRDTARADQMAQAALAPVGLAGRRDLPVSILQTGEKYLIELAKALQSRPRWLIIDELTATMHASEVDVFAGLLADHLAQGGGALFVSHRLPELRRFCDTISVLRNGKLVFDGALAGVGDDELVKWAGGGHRDAPALMAPARDGEVRVKAKAIRPLPNAQPLDLGFRAGEITGIGGLPDQGQKQVLRLLAGLRAPSPGESVSLDGEALPLGSAAAMAAKGISFVSGDRDEMVFAPRSIRENMLAPFAAMRGLKMPSDAEITAALERLATRHAGISRPIGGLSGGNQQKILVARCLLLNPRLILAEDCTKGIDVAARNDVHHLLRELAHVQGTTVIVTSSDDQELAELCDRVLVLDGGRIIAELNRAEGGLDAQAIVSAYMKQERAA
ncbi:sugar ABC transporter ATP-binding protein [Sinirhodobacter populi]|uniref:Sugar ABC transporter ATP-binding protein n=1 Tax=Paenirhodobacter populi TaxID=2306993 RepID=A0A443K710_9RHOB|nr:sugar ABC transporter ATP-binding protein [Sinirhodobacter populi]RWR28453.1 sugar ABC transporter ATP-binding protein [Sinirhodobacter populi]